LSCGDSREKDKVKTGEKYSLHAANLPFDFSHFPVLIEIDLGGGGNEMIGKLVYFGVI
jgi:hypothetical protein